MKGLTLAVLLTISVNLIGQSSPDTLQKIPLPKVVYAQLTVVMKMTKLDYKLEIGFDQGQYATLRSYLSKCETTPDALTLLGQNGWEVIEHEVKVGTSFRDQYFLLKKDYTIYPEETNGGISSPP